MSYQNRARTRQLIFKTLTAAVAAAGISACSIIDLSRLEITSLPAAAGDILAKGEQIRITFSDDVAEDSAESVFRLSGPDGTCDGIFSWNRRSMSFRPSDSLKPGRRYRIKLKGQLRGLSGREYSIDEIIPFYYLSDRMPTVLLEKSPAADDAIPTGGTLRLSFSRQIEKNCFENEFSLSPDTPFSCSWDSEGKSVTISPDGNWKDCMIYKWTISDDLKDFENFPVDGDYDGSFLVQNTEAAPGLISIHPAVEKDGSISIFRTLGADQLKRGDHIYLHFSSPVKSSSLTRKLRTAPSVGGFCGTYGDSGAIFFINDRLECGRDYQLIIEEGLEGTGGSLSGEKFTGTFRLAESELTVNSVRIEGLNGSRQADLGGGSGQEDCIDLGDIGYHSENMLHFLLTLSSAFSADRPAARSGFEKQIRMEPVFPPSLPDPEIFFLQWENDLRLRIVYSGFKPSKNGQPVYYRLRISEGGAEADDGGMLKKELTIAFRGAAE